MSNYINDILGRSIGCLKGVGQSRERLFNKLNIYILEDVIMHYPREYEDRSNVKKIAMLNDGESCGFEGVIISNVSENRIRKGMTIYKVRIKDDSGTIEAVWFNQNYLKSILHVGDRYYFFGKINRKYNRLEVQNPVYEKAGSKEMKKTCRIVPIYPSTAKLTQNVMRMAVRNVLELIGDGMIEILPEWMRNKYHLSEVNYSLWNIHFPKSFDDFKNARYRLVFEELLVFQMGLLNIKDIYKNSDKGIVFNEIYNIRHFIDGLPFKLTQAQKKVFKEVEQDMESTKVMNRLVQGDVGSGKTVVAAMALFKAVKNGYQGVFMAPTEILATQHFNWMKKMMAEHDITTRLLTGKLTKKQKSDILQDIGDGNVDIVIGTHALIEKDVCFNKLGLVITDEQHRFGVRQRALLSQKGSNPDVVVMTATPIPRTLAFILYGDLDISIIDEMPPGRKQVKTYTVDNSKRERINNFIKKVVTEGRQVFIVCPLIEESDTIEAKSALETAEKIAGEDFKELNVGLIHGKMRPADKENVMNEFIEGKLNILVSTTVIEVGVDIPNATLMVIENAERFGLAQLHQLRGRVGRCEHQSYCILYNEGKSDVTRQRMDVMCKTSDGFQISEKDLELRGPGDFFGTRQHGIPDLKIANLYKDIEILKIAQEVALKVLEEDDELIEKQNKNLKMKVAERFERRLKLLSLN